MTFEPPPRMEPRHWGAIAAITAVGFALRVIGLDHAPPALWFDEGLNGLNALGIIGGETPFHFARHGLPQEPIHMYAIAAMMGLVGTGSMAIRLTSVVIGTLTLPLVFGCLREALRSNRLALTAAAALAVMRWHVHFSRLGLRTIWVPLIVAAACWLGLVLLRRPMRRLVAVALGLVMAIGCHTYLAARLIPIVLFGLLIWDATHRPYRLGLLRSMGIVVVVFILGVAPLAVHLIRHPALFEGRVAEISLLSWIGGGDDENIIKEPKEQPPPEPLAPVGQGHRFLNGVGENLLANLWVFSSWGDHVPKHGIPRVPLFDPITAALFLAGLALALARWGEGPGHALLVLWLGTLLMASVLSHGAPNALRTLGAAPAAMALAVLGVDAVSTAAGKRWGQRAGLTVLGLWLAWFAGIETARYHLEWARRPDVWADFSGRETTVATEIAALPASEPVAVFDGWLGHDAFAFLTRDRGDLVPLSEMPPLTAELTAGGGQVHLFLNTEFPPQRQALSAIRDQCRAVSLTHRERVMRTPDGRPFATHVVIGPSEQSGAH
jgi:4-amino-4-deoxy-L-arabinose transferase-like glycosyltransferase